MAGRAGSESRGLASAVLGGTGSTLLGNVFLFCAGILTARRLGVEGKGVFVLSVLFPQLALNVLSLGLGNSAIYYISRRRWSTGVVIGTSLSIIIPLGIACALTAPAVWAAAGGSAQGGRCISATMWSVPLSMVYALVRHVMLGVQRYDRFNILNFLDKGALLAVMGVGSGWAGTDVVRWCQLYLAASLLSALAASAMALEVEGLRPSVDRSYAGEALGYGLRGHLGWLAELLNYRLDMVLVSALAGVGALGLYSVAVGVAEALWILPGCLSVVMLPRVAARQVPPADLTAPVCRILTGVSVISAAGLGIAGGILLDRLYGEAFRPALQPLLVLLPGVASLSIAKLLGADLSARGLPGRVSLVSLVSLVTTLVLDLIFVPRLGASGAALASAVAYGLGTALCVGLYVRHTGVRPASLLLPRAGDLTRLLTSLRQALGAAPSGSPGGGKAS